MVLNFLMNDAALVCNRYRTLDFLNSDGCDDLQYSPKKACDQRLFSINLNLWLYEPQHCLEKDPRWS